MAIRFFRQLKDLGANHAAHQRNGDNIKAFELEKRKKKQEEGKISIQNSSDNDDHYTDFEIIE